MIADHVKQATTMVQPSALTGALGVPQGHDIPSPTLQFPIGPQNQCVVVKLLTITIRKKKTFPFGYTEAVRVDVYPYPTKDDYQDVPFRTSSSNPSSSSGLPGVHSSPEQTDHAAAPSSSGQTGISSHTEQVDDAEEAVETIVQPYPMLGDPVRTLFIICHNSCLDLHSWCVRTFTILQRSSTTTFYRKYEVLSHYV